MLRTKRKVTQIMKGLHMTNPNISTQINSVAFKATVIVLVLGIVSLFLPLGAPGATQEEAAEWLINDLTAYMLGWITYTR